MFSSNSNNLKYYNYIRVCDYGYSIHFKPISTPTHQDPDPDPPRPRSTHTQTDPYSHPHLHSHTDLSEITKKCISFQVIIEKVTIFTSQTYFTFFPQCVFFFNTFVFPKSFRHFKRYTARVGFKMKRMLHSTT